MISGVSLVLALLRDLAASIEAQSLIHALTVRRKGDLFERVNGFRRHAPLFFLARTKGIAPWARPVNVRALSDVTSDDEALRVSFAEDLARKSLDTTEKAIAFVRLRDEFGKMSGGDFEQVAVVPRSTRVDRSSRLRRGEASPRSRARRSEAEPR